MRIKKIVPNQVLDRWFCMMIKLVRFSGFTVSALEYKENPMENGTVQVVLRRTEELLTSIHLYLAILYS